VSECGYFWLFFNKNKQLKKFYESDLKPLDAKHSKAKNLINSFGEIFKAL